MTRTESGRPEGKATARRRVAAWAPLGSNRMQRPCLFPLSVST